MHIQGSFDLGMKSKQVWVYTNNLGIDWLITVKAPRDDLIAAYKKIESEALKKTGKETMSPDDELEAELMKFDEPGDKNEAPDKLPDAVPEKAETVEAMESTPPPSTSKGISESESLNKFHELTIYFLYGQSGLNDKNKITLKDWVNTVKVEEQNMVLHMDGHTDVDGAANNQRTSERRARTIKNYLVDELGLKVECIATGYGEKRPAVQGPGKDARDRNRRVELYFVIKIETDQSASK